MEKKKKAFSEAPFLLVHSDFTGKGRALRVKDTWASWAQGLR